LTPDPFPRVGWGGFKEVNDDGSDVKPEKKEKPGKQKPDKEKEKCDKCDDDKKKK